MENYYTTGELAKICNVTKRTVQYYDKEDIVKPSKISDGGRRLYNDEDLKKFMLVCLYRDLNIPLHEIKNIMESDHECEKLITLLKEHQEKINEQIQQLSNLKVKVSTILHEVSLYKTTSIVSVEELRTLIIRKKDHKRYEQMIYLLLTFYIFILVLSCIIISVIDDRFMPVVIGMNILLLFALVFLHASQNAYVCPNCTKKLKIGFLKDLFTLNNGRKGKYVKCPYCQKRSWIAETFKDD